MLYVLSHLLSVVAFSVSVGEIWVILFFIALQYHINLGAALVLHYFTAIFAAIEIHYYAIDIHDVGNSEWCQVECHKKSRNVWEIL